MKNAAGRIWKDPRADNKGGIVAAKKVTFTLPVDLVRRIKKLPVGKVL